MNLPSPRLDRLLSPHGPARGAIVWLVLVAAGVAAPGCAAAPPTGPETPGARPPDGNLDTEDRSLCDWQGLADREPVETAGSGAVQPNVRRVYQVFGHGADSRRVLVCREVDTNLDGYKDTVRKYSDEGQSREEQSDTDGDGRIDTWITFVKGRLDKVEIDTNHDGQVDEWKTYGEGGKLSRVRRDTNFDTKPDVWEMYRGGRLERMGVDLNGDERVDRWDHDTEWRRALERDARHAEEEAAKKKQEELDRLEKEALEAAGEGGAPKAPSPPDGGH